MLAQCAIWRGDLYMWRKAKIHIAEANAKDDREREIITLAICAVDSMLYNVKEFPEWFKSGSFEMLPKDSLPAAKVYYVKLLMIYVQDLAMKKFDREGMGGLALMKVLPNTIEPLITQAEVDKTLLVEIYLRLLCAITY